MFSVLYKKKKKPEDESLLHRCFMVPIHM